MQFCGWHVFKIIINNHYCTMGIITYVQINLQIIFWEKNGGWRAYSYFCRLSFLLQQHLLCDLSLNCFGIVHIVRCGSLNHYHILNFLFFKLPLEKKATVTSASRKLQVYHMFLCCLLLCGCWTRCKKMKNRRHLFVFRFAPIHAIKWFTIKHGPN